MATKNSRARTPPPKTPKGVRYGGRQVGTPNKNDALARLDLLNTLRSKGYDPAARLIEAAIEAEENYIETKKENANKNNPVNRGQTTALEVVIRANAELMQYVYPKLKNVDFGENAKDSFQTLSEMVRSIANGTK